MMPGCLFRPSRQLVRTMKAVPLRSHGLPEAEYAAFVLEVRCRGAVLSAAALEIATTPLGSTCARLTEPVLCFDETRADAGDLLRLLRAHGFEAR